MQMYAQTRSWNVLNLPSVSLLASLQATSLEIQSQYWTENVGLLNEPMVEARSAPWRAGLRYATVWKRHGGGVTEGMTT